MNPISPPSTEDQILKLRQLVNILNKKHQESLLALSQKETEYSESHKHVQEAREQAQKYQEEAEELRNNYQILQLQFESYKQQCGNVQGKSTEADEEVLALRQQHMQLMDKLKSAEEKIKSLEEELASSKQKEQQLERVIQFLRQRGEESHLEVGEIEKELQNTKATLQTKEKQIQELEYRLKNHLEQRPPISSEIPIENEEIHSRIRLVQQHLAKKVRETTLLNEKIEEQKKLFNDLQNDYHLLRTRTSELEATLDLERQHHRKMQEQLETSLQAAEDKLLQSDEKYACINEKFVNSDILHQDHRKLEEKYLQIQTLVANLNTLLQEIPKITDNNHYS